MSYGIGARVEVIAGCYIGRWIEPLESGEIIRRCTAPSGQEVYRVRLDKDGKEYTFTPSEIEELTPAQ